MHTLIIVESPSKAKKITAMLDENYTVLASFGHVRQLAKGGNAGLGVDLNNKFKPRYTMIEDKYAVLDKIIAASEKADLILLASDPDREGTAIAWHVKECLAGCKKPMKRMTFNEITKKAILKAIADAHEIDMNVVHAQEARSILDRIVGFKVSPFLMNSYGPKLSAGRVQSVASRLIIDREEEIDAFVPEEYWVIKPRFMRGTAMLNTDSTEFTAKYDPRISSEDEAMRVKSLIEADDAEFIVSSVESDEELRKPSPPMITLELQRVMSKSFGFAPERTMKAAQSLYEAGNITYLRSDSMRVEPEAMKNLKAWIKDNNYPLPKKENVYKNKDAAQDAHECIRPTDINNKLSSVGFGAVSEDEVKVYDVIWKYFVASQMEPAKYSTLKVSIILKSDPSIVFKASGKALLSKGFLEIMGVGDNSKIEIPALVKGWSLNLSAKPVSCEKKFTQPPARFTDDTLLKTLSNNKIGRPSTYAEILKTIAARNYVEKTGSTYRATDLGKKITNVLKERFTFMDFNFSADMERRLDDIEQGKVKQLDMLNHFYDIFKGELSLAYQKNGATLCSKCGSAMVNRTSRTGESFSGCSGYPLCKNIISERKSLNS
jgi:DNA topoisomerase-1